MLHVIYIWFTKQCRETSFISEFYMHCCCSLVYGRIFLHQNLDTRLVGWISIMLGCLISYSPHIADTSEILRMQSTTTGPPFGVYLILISAFKIRLGKISTWMKEQTKWLNVNSTIKMNEEWMQLPTSASKISYQVNDEGSWFLD